MPCIQNVKPTEELYEKSLERRADGRIVVAGGWSSISEDILSCTSVRSPSAATSSARTSLFFGSSNPTTMEFPNTKRAPKSDINLTALPRVKSPVTATGIVRLRPIVATSGVIPSMAVTWMSLLGNVMVVCIWRFSTFARIACGAPLTFKRRPRMALPPLGRLNSSNPVYGESTQTTTGRGC